MRLTVVAIMLLTLGACSETNPVYRPGQGVGFGGYDAYQKQRAARDAELQRQARATETPDVPAQAQQPTQPAVPQGPLSALKPTTANSNNPGISDEQEFGAVADRESIESDRERLKRQSAQYVQIKPTAVPTGSSGGGASVVNFALSTTNAVGESLHRRSKALARSRFVRNCMKYPSPDMAQAAFLQAGGPQRDGKGLDPDGDGFACAWDPQPFRNARSN